MTLLVQNNGEGDALSAIVAKAAAENLVLRLFKSNTTPGETDTAATRTPKPISPATRRSP
jgi:hypothetical protein